jgi:hypothetical protein
MAFIWFDEPIPTEREYSRGHPTIAGVVLAMARMATGRLLI